MKYPFIRVESLIRKDPQTGEEEVVYAEEVVANQVLVQLAEDKTEGDLIAAVENVRGKVLSKLKLAYAEAYIVSLPEISLDAVPDAIRGLKPFRNTLQLVEGNGVQRALMLPDDPRLSEQWGLRNTGADGGVANADIRAESAWNVQRGNTSVLIAVSDTGVDYRHTDLRANIFTNTFELAGNGYDDDGNGYVDDTRGWNFANGNKDPDDTVYHGTRVSGIIGASGDNGVGIAGVCWTCRLLPIRVLDEYGGYNSDIAEGFDYARRMGAKIINASHGGNYQSDLIQNAVDSLQQYGVLLIAAAGNESVNNDSTPLYPASHENGNIISVGYSDRSDKIAQYSNWGLRSVDLMAPGVGILSTSPGGYATGSGSSYATPYVSGVAGLLKAQNPGWTYGQIRAAILRNVDPVTNFYGKTTTGGRLNAYKAFRGPLYLGDSVDSVNLPWTVGGSTGWIPQSTFTHDGYDAVQSASIGHNENSWVETTVNGPGTLRFWWKVSSEKPSAGRADFLQFTVNGGEQAYIDGEVNWQQRTFTLGEGNFTLRWTYSKNGSGSVRQDRGWLDQIRFDGVPPSILSHPASQLISVGATLQLNVSAKGAQPLRYQWRRNGVNITGATSSTLSIANVQSTHAGNYVAVVSNPYGIATSQVATVSMCSYLLSSSSRIWSAEGGSGTFDVTASGECIADVSSTNDWISITSASQVGNGTVSYTVAPSTLDFARSGAVKVGTKIHSVVQLGRLAPPTVSGRNFHLVGTNSTGDFAFEVSSLLTLSAITNTYRIVQPNGAVAAHAGTFSYSRDGGSAGAIVLNTPSGTQTLTLSFNSTYGGGFELSTEDGSSQTGTFTIGPGQPDFNGDNLTDLVWRSSGGILASWAFNGTNFLQSRLLRNGQSSPAGWTAAVLADINNDGSSDVLFQHTDSRLLAWHMRGSEFLGALILRNGTLPGSGWRLASSSDFNNDGKTDLLLQHTTGRLAVWLMDGSAFLQSVLLRNGLAAPGNSVVGMADFNGDGQRDILWQTSSGSLAVWFMVGTEFQSSTLLRNGLSPGAAWRAKGIADFNFDGSGDILLQDNGGRVAVWLMSQSNFVKSMLLRNGQGAGTAWQIVGPK